MSNREFIDKYLGKAISKTFTVFLIATAYLYFGKLNGTQWIIIATVYLGSTKVTETILKLKDKL
jgi:hypothetical protein